MSRIYKTAAGRQIDIDSLILQNEQTIAVGNMGVNARGDELGPGGIVVATRNQNMDDYYKLNTQVAVESPSPARKDDRKVKIDKSLISLHELEMIEDDEPAEVIKPEQEPEIKKQTGLRGNLAGAVAKETVVEQPEITPPGKTKGPQRI